MKLARFGIRDVLGCCSFVSFLFCPIFFRPFVNFRYVESMSQAITVALPGTICGSACVRAECNLTTSSRHLRFDNFLAAVSRFSDFFFVVFPSAHFSMTDAIEAVS